MTGYLDSSAAVKLYVKEALSLEVGRYVRTLEPPLPFSHLHDLEIRNGLRLKAFRKEAPVAAVEASLKLLEKDLADGILARPELDWLEAFRRAEELSEARLRRIGARALDLLHVASALLLGADRFLTFDDRQRALARAAGLEIVEPDRLEQASRAEDKSPVPPDEAAGATSGGAKRRTPGAGRPGRRRRS